MTSTFGFLSFLALFVYGVTIGLVILVIYVLVLATKALKIYIQKNS
jgi:hypothetical protein